MKAEKGEITQDPKKSLGDKNAFYSDFDDDFTNVLNISKHIKLNSSKMHQLYPKICKKYFKQTNNTQTGKTIG